MAIQLPALDIQPPQQQPGVLDQYAKAVQLKSLLGGQQLQQMQIQEAQKQMATQEALSQAYQSAFSVDPTTGSPKIDRNKLAQTLAVGGHGDAIPGIIEGFTKMDESAQKLLETQGKNTQFLQDYFGETAAAIKAAKYDPVLTDAALVHGEAAAPQFKKDFETMRQHFKQDPSSIQQVADGLIASSTKQREIAAKELDAQARMKSAGKLPEGETPLPNIPQMNEALKGWYQVRNPGKPLPPELTLQPGTTRKDFDELQKVMNATESAQGSKEQQSISNGFRQAMLDLARQGAQERKDRADEALDKGGRKPVIGTDPKTGRPVLVPASQASEMGVTDAMDASADIVNKSHAARAWLTMATKQGDGKSPDSMGILQLIDKLDKRGKLGAIASRWNEFLAGKVGAGDPDFAALRTKMGLSNTKLMQAHVGSRGGAFMLEHFERLANDKKMDASTLREGVKSEVDYMKDVAMEPGKAGEAASPAAAAPMTATGPNGHKIVVKNGKWVDAETGAPVQ